MPRALFSGFLAVAAWAAQLPYHQSGFLPGTDGKPEGWSTWSARAETAPRAYVDSMHSRGEAGSLAISGNSNAAAYGGWERRLAVVPGRWYKLEAFYRARGLTYERGQVLMRLDWQHGGKRAGQPEYAYRTEREGDWTRVWVEGPAPDGAEDVRVQLYLSNAPQGTVWWDDVSLQEMPAPAARPVTVASVNLRPRNTSGPEESVRRFVELAAKGAPRGTDLIVLPEGITVVGTGKEDVEVAQTVPGPATGMLSELARKTGAWVAAGLYERDGAAVYNTAVLIDRKGNLAGKYRKVYLPREEIEAGLTPGIEYPVFETDFGKVGMMICWDVQYTDPARGLALAGAEIILMPIWGGSLTLAKARAIENQVFLASSGYDFPSQVLDPNGEVIASAPEGSVAVAKIDLNRRYVDPWLGNMRGRLFKELRLDVPVAPGE